MSGDLCADRVDLESVIANLYVRAGLVDEDQSKAMATNGARLLQPNWQGKRAD